jgi:hypothetical protein
LDRKFPKARKVRRRLGVALSPIIFKPKGIHNSTFVRLKPGFFRLEYWAWKEEGKQLGMTSMNLYLEVSGTQIKPSRKNCIFTAPLWVSRDNAYSEQKQMGGKKA